MKVTVGSIEDFIENLKIAGSGGVVDPVRFRVDSEPVQREAIEFNHTVYATALISAGPKLDGGHFLLEYIDAEERCSAGDFPPAIRHAELNLRKFCEEMRISVAPGRIEI